MPVKRRFAKEKKHRVTPEAVEAFLAGDFHGLHSALGLRPWQPSPLPLEITALGVDQFPLAGDHGGSWAESWALVQKLQRELIKATGGRLPQAEMPTN